MLKKIVLMLGIGICVMVGAKANAGFQFGVDSSSFVPGTSGFVNVFVFNDSAPTAADGYIVNLVGSATGTSLSNLGLSSTATVAPGSLFNTFFNQSGTSTPPSSYIIGANNFSGSPVPSGRTDLFRIAFNSSAAVPVGSTFRFDVAATSSLVSGVTSLNPTFSGGTITAVPEPSSFAVCAVALVAGGAIRQLRRRKAIALS